jgi:hypothetical protein
MHHHVSEYAYCQSVLPEYGLFASDGAMPSFRHYYLLGMRDVALNRTSEDYESLYKP